MAELSHQEEERRLLRPYRRFVGIVFAVLAVVLAGVILRGIIRTLDRLPSVDRLQRPERVDTRALIACGDDLDRLEERIRRRSGRLLTRPSSAGPLEEAWRKEAERLEADRIRIAARCRLEESSNDPAVRDLSAASLALEDLLRTYGLLVSRYAQEGRPQSVEAKASLRRALQTLRARK